MTKTTLTDEYVLVETDDIDFSMLRLAVQNQQVTFIDDLPIKLLEAVVKELE